MTSELVAKMISGHAQSRTLADRLKRDVSAKVKAKMYAEIPGTVSSYRKDINALYPDIDDVLLAFFPDFRDQFNALLRPRARLESDKSNRLPTEMRIFALWRLGVKKNEDIANCMGYSLNTVKSYKTRVLGSTDLIRDEFYERLMDIDIATGSI